jgi:hypothetical protein
MTLLPKLGEPEAPSLKAGTFHCSSTGNRVEQSVPKQREQIEEGGRTAYVEKSTSTFNGPWGSREENVWGGARRQTRSIP